jgi:hypothetical protein
VNTPDTTANPQPQDDGFGKIVLDIVHDNLASMAGSGGDLDIAETAARPVIEAIIDAYAPRIRLARQQTYEAQQEAYEAQQAAAAYAAMDRAQQDILGHVKTYIAQLVMNNARHAAYIEYLTDVRNSVHNLLTDASETASDTVDTKALSQALLGTHPFPHRPEEPLPLAIAVDSRWIAGHFKVTGGHDISLPFLGWSMVVYTSIRDSAIEAVFLGRDAKPMAQSQLARLGVQFVRLS